VVSNPHSKKRISFFKTLSQHKHIASGGKVLNNIDDKVDDKISFLKKFKFNIAFENSQYPGYVTEKIVEAFMARTVPIYWGAPDVSLEFNPKSFINISDFDSDEDAIKYIINLDKDEYDKYLLQNPFINGIVPEYCKSEYLKNFILDCVQQLTKTSPVSKSLKFQTYKFKLLLKRLEYRLNKYTGHLKGYR
jgi:hypothetical protein